MKHQDKTNELILALAAQIERLEGEKKELLEALGEVKDYLGSDVRNEIESLIQKMKQ